MGENADLVSEPATKGAREDTREDRIVLLLLFSGNKDSIALTTSSSLALRINSRMARLCCGKMRCKSSMEDLNAWSSFSGEKTWRNWGELSLLISPSLISLADRLRLESLVELSSSKLTGLVGSVLIFTSQTCTWRVFSSSLDSSWGSRKECTKEQAVASYLIKKHIVLLFNPCVNIRGGHTSRTLFVD